MTLQQTLCLLKYTLKCRNRAIIPGIAALQQQKEMYEDWKYRKHYLENPRSSSEKPLELTK